MEILIIGYGNIGKHIFEEFKQLHPDIYDINIPCFSELKNKKYDFAFVCVPTEMKEDGSCDISIVEKTITLVDADVIIIKSTVPPLTTDNLIAVSGKNIVFSPEHYGTTQHCKNDPGFVILGGKREASDKVAQLYYKIKSGYYRFYYTDIVTAELSKYMQNSFLAIKVTFCNEFAGLAEKFGVGYPELRELFVADERISPSHTFCYKDNPYYNSHCLNKDVPALIHFAGTDAPLVAWMHKINLSKKHFRKQGEKNHDKSNN